MLDFIKNLFNGILSFFASLFSGFAKLTGGKKSQEGQPNNQAAIKPATSKKGKTKGYFMELDEEAEANGSQLISSSVATVKSATKELAKAAEPVAAKVTAATQELAKTAESVANKPAKEPAKAAESVANKPAKEPAKTSEPKGAKSAGKVQLKPDEVELVQTAEGVKVEPAKPAKAPVSPNGQAHAETTFAPKYLIPSNSSNSRRRPGPNMNPFLDMARQVNARG
ncbi:MAG: hypothetical protein JOZ78_03235 [Chroococcidiopsidaceae cyanobacterium CP_BM_ER_R8_30]|nr:hypothetical protein [Chroococcidiopsidaceae cyanobacterium CP_BM_ER_R8_30]